ncbi:MAG: Uma2 family endonuclease [Pyrinomonadaceae bacterium]
MSVRAKRLRFSVDDYYTMIGLGMLKNVERAEIIDGELVETMPVGNAHAFCVKKLSEILRDKLGKSVTHSVQDPIWLDEYNEPIPDIALLKRRDDFYRGKAPIASDVHLLIEISDTSLDYDRNRKIPLYAHAGIPEVWILNLQNSTIELHCQPRDYSFAIVKVFRREEMAQSERLPDLVLSVSEIFD